MVDLLRASSSPSPPRSYPSGAPLSSSSLVSSGRRLPHPALAGRGPGGHLLARPRVRRVAVPYQLIVGHLDTVWPLGTVRSIRRPENGRFHGPGSFDVKGGLVQHIFALAALSASASAEVTPCARQLRRGDRQRRLEAVHPAAGTSRRPGVRPRAAGGADRVAEDEPQGRRPFRGRRRLGPPMPGEPRTGRQRHPRAPHQIQRLFALTTPSAG